MSFSYDVPIKTSILGYIDNNKKHLNLYIYFFLKGGGGGGGK